MNATTTPTPESGKTEYPSAVYAAAGIGDLAYQQLRKLPAYAEQLRAEAEKLRVRAPEFRTQAGQKADALRAQAGGQFSALRADATGEAGRFKARAAELGAQATDKAAELTNRVDIEKIRASLVTAAQTVTERAMRLYEELVARGEKVVVAGEVPQPPVPDFGPPPAAEQTFPAAEPTATTVEPVGGEAVPVAEKPAKKPSASRKPKTGPVGTD